MKIFLRREGGQIPTYCPQGTIETNELLPEEARLVADALEPEVLRKISEPRPPIPEGFKYYIRLQRDDDSVEEFQVQEADLEPKSQEALNLLINRIQRSLRDS
jgi:hypothetical protein